MAVQWPKSSQGMEEQEQLGVFFLKNSHHIDEDQFETEDVNDAFETNIPKQYHELPDVMKAKHDKYDDAKTMDSISVLKILN